MVVSNDSCPSGCIAEGWPEREPQVGRVNADTEGSIEQGVSLGWSEQGVQPGPWALLKSGGFRHFLLDSLIYPFLL